jgi:hypothetical protein
MKLSLRRNRRNGAQTGNAVRTAGMPEGPPWPHSDPPDAR